MQPTFRVATWNLWWRFGDPDARRPAIEGQLQRVQPDVLGLQEVWATDRVHLAGSLGALLDLRVGFTPAPDSSHWHVSPGLEEFQVGNAILSRWPIEKLDAVALPPGDQPDESRYALSALIATPYGSLRFTTTHLNSGWWHNDIRRLQLQTLVRWLADQPATDLPMILVGDFNAGPDFDEIRPLTGRATPYDHRLSLVDAWEYANPHDPGYTWDRANPHVDGRETQHRIDFVLAGRWHLDGRGRVRAAERFGINPIEEVVPSDHYGVVVEVQGRPD